MEHNGENMEIIELIDETGEAVQFRLLAGIEYEGAQYIAVTDDVSDDEEGECSVSFLLVETDEEGESYESVEDETLMEELFVKFLKLVGEDEGEDDE